MTCQKSPVPGLNYAVFDRRSRYRVTEHHNLGTENLHKGSLKHFINDPQSQSALLNGNNGNHSWYHLIPLGQDRECWNTAQFWNMQVEISFGLPRTEIGRYGTALLHNGTPRCCVFLAKAKPPRVVSRP